MDEQLGYLKKCIGKLLRSSSDEDIGDDGEYKLDVLLLNQVKKLVRDSDSYIEITFEMISNVLAKNNVRHRINAVLLSDYLFNRSTHFRSLTVEKLKRFMELTVGLNGKALPNPAVEALKLKTVASATLTRWNEKYGAKDRSLRMGLDFMRKQQSHGTLDFAVKRDFQLRQIDRERLVRLKSAKTSLYLDMTESVGPVLDELRQSMEQMNVLFGLLVPRAESILNDPEMQHVSVDESNGGFSSATTVVLAEQLPVGVVETTNNTSLYDNLRDIIRVIKNRLEGRLDKWIGALQQAIGEDSRVEIREIDERMAEAKEIRKALDTALEMCHELGVRLDDDEEFFEVADMYPLVEETSTPSRMKRQKLESSEAIANNTIQSGISTDRLYRSDATSDPLSIHYGVTAKSSYKEESADLDHSPPESDELRKALLISAPVVEYDQDLHYWDKEKIPFNTSGIEFHHRFLGDGKGENFLSAETMSSLKTRTVTYEAPPKPLVELKKCRYPMKNRALCPRMHSEICTYHGKIVPRDDEGNALDMALRQEEESKAKVNSFLEDFSSVSKKSTKPKLTARQRLEKKISNPLSVRRTISQISEQSERKLRDRSAFKW
eukprot:Partr_v1_DN28842_c4_g1_i1_m33959 putative UV-stimulated scaffold protein A